MATHVRPFLMFQGRAEEAMRLYVSLLPDSEVIEAQRYGPGEPGPEGSLKRGRFRLGDQELICLDSPVQHAFSFTPSVSLFVTCESEAQLRRLAQILAEDGEVLMPLDHYGFSRLFAWVNDRYGVSWQLNLD